MLHLMSVRIDKPNKSIVNMAVETSNLFCLASIFENSKDVVNFKIDNGIEQFEFGFSEFDKWVKRNY